MSLAIEQTSGGKVARSKVHASRTGARLFGSALFALLGGCGLFIDTERQQCSVVDDCAKAFGGTVEDFACTEGLCTTVARCTPETVAQYCGDSPTVQCVEGQCVDPVWGCWDEPDNRPAPTTATTTINLRFIEVLSTRPQELVITACRSASIDPMCSVKLPGATTTFDPVSGLLTIAGIMQGPVFSYRIMAEAAPSEMLRAIDYSANRPPREGDPVADISMIPENLANFAPGMAELILGRGTIVARVFDCTGAGAAGVTFGLSEPLPELGIVYIGEEAGSVSPTATATSIQGIASLYNIPIDRAVTLVANISPTRQLTFALRTFADRHSFVDVHPRNFGATAGTP